MLPTELPTLLAAAGRGAMSRTTREEKTKGNMDANDGIRVFSIKGDPKLFSLCLFGQSKEVNPTSSANTQSEAKSKHFWGWLWVCSPAVGLIHRTWEPAWCSAQKQQPQKHSIPRKEQWTDAPIQPGSKRLPAISAQHHLYGHCSVCPLQHPVPCSLLMPALHYYYYYLKVCTRD